MTLTILSRVRLTDQARALQPELANATGAVHSLGDGWAEIAWPRFRSWHKAGDLEPINPTPERKIQ